MEETQKKQRRKSPSRGGFRPGSGRKPGSRTNITITELLDQVQKQTSGRPYEEILIEDFLQARDHKDHNLVVKYHHLILNKVMHTLNRVEVKDNADDLANKRRLFEEALAAITNIKED